MKVYLFVLFFTLLHAARGAGNVFSNSFFHSSGSSSYQNSGSSSYYSHSHSNADPCPVFTDFSADFQLSSDDTGYPDVAIADALANLALTAPTDCLTPLPSVPVPQDPTLVHGLATCPSVTPELRTFSRNGAKCWIVRDLQEPLNFTQCGTTHCHTCDDTFNYGVQSRCIPQYEYLSVWALCEDLPVGNQIAKERIILPVSCSCKKLQCNSNPWWWKRK